MGFSDYAKPIAIGLGALAAGDLVFNGGGFLSGIGDSLGITGGGTSGIGPVIDGGKYAASLGGSTSGAASGGFFSDAGFGGKLVNSLTSPQGIATGLALVGGLADSSSKRDQQEEALRRQDEATAKAEALALKKGLFDAMIADARAGAAGGSGGSGGASRQAAINALIQSEFNRGQGVSNALNRAAANVTGALR